MFGPSKLVLEDGSIVEHRDTIKHIIVGDYLIKHENVHHSICPAAAFEAGYSELGTVAAVLAGAEALATAGESFGDTPPKPTEAEFQRAEAIGKRFDAIDRAMSVMWGDG